ncbi:MAG: type II toxin-antitoxin system RatA family toxin [Fimbriimonadales bacterium]
MPIIELRNTIDAPVQRVVEIARDVERFSEFMPDVKSVKIIDQSDDGTTQQTEWVGIIKQFSREIAWTQEDVWHEDANRIDFHQVKGDYDKMEGYWQFNEVGGKTEFVNYLDYEYKVPLLGALVTKVVDFLVRQNLNSIMDGIEKRSTR